MPRLLFKPGESGNPAGRPKGAKSAIKLLELAGDSFTDADLADVIAMVFKKAKEGDLRAIEMILDRTVPKVKPAFEFVENWDLAERLEAARKRVQEFRAESPPIFVITGVPDADDPAVNEAERGRDWPEREKRFRLDFDPKQ